MNRLARIAANVLQADVGLFSIVAKDRLFFKAHEGLDAHGASVEGSFCLAAVDSGETLVVEDAPLDERFKDYELVKGQSKIRFYAGTPVRAPTGDVVGTLCVLHSKAMRPSANRIRALEELASAMESVLLLREWALELHETLSESAATKAGVLNDIAHDLATPLTPLRLQVAALRSHAGPGLEWKSLDRIEKNLVQLEGVLSQATRIILDDATERPEIPLRHLAQRPSRTNPWHQPAKEEAETSGIAVKRRKEA